MLINKLHYYLHFDYFTFTWEQHKILERKQKHILKNLIQTWTMRLRWQSAVNSRPCFSDHASIRLNLRLRRIPHCLVQRFGRVSHKTLFRSHMLIKWNSWENIWIAKAAFTRHRLSIDIAGPSTAKTSAVKKDKTQLKSYTTKNEHSSY